MLPARTKLRVRGADQVWRRWLVLAAAVLLLSACRGLDSQVTEIAPPPSLSSQTLQQESPLAPQVHAAVDANTAAQPASSNRSLSDSNATPRPTPSGDRPLALAQHTTPEPAVGSAHSAVAIPNASAPTTSMPNAATPDQVQTMVQVSPGYGAPAPQVYPQPCFPPSQPYEPCGPEPCASCGPEPWCADGVPCGGWRPPGLPCPWPDDEYLCDGGDKIPSVQVRQDWSVDGLQLEDTVVHYDTVNGQTHVEPTNRVCVYAPRFASVRKVYGILQHDHLDRIAKVDKPVPVEGLGDVQIATTSVQPVQPVLNQGTENASGIRERMPPIGLDNRQGLVGIQGRVLPYEDITDLQRKLLTNSEKARLADLILAAAQWSHDTAVQVVIDSIVTHEDIATTAAESVHVYSLHGKPRLRVCKLASRKEARPGETVEFTLQFENVGDQTIGNVTVIDNLTTRLEYVEESQTSSLQANFSTTDNQGESLTLRWEIVEPMKVGEGGVIRFTCRVR